MLTVVEQILLGVALGMDCFSVALATGLMHRRFMPGVMAGMAVLFGIFQALMPLMGWLCTVYFGDYVASFDHWIAFALLAFIGTKMITDGRKPEEERTFDATKITVLFTLSIATSIDALAVGVSFTCMGMKTWQDIESPITIIGIASFLMALIGNLIGITLGRKFKFPAEIVGGIILVLIGLKILYEHLSES